ncbi:MAG TPA: hypothetical protein VLU92_03100 [Candidatus Dormibacteraeota bacterium]|nr:hypothetical protein [Candidatus Dormibacteraeota bacterium]
MSLFELLAVGTSGTVGLGMAGMAIVQSRSDTGLLGVVGLSSSFLAVAVLLLIGAATKGKVPGWSPTFYTLASMLSIAVGLLALAFAWGANGVPTMAAGATTDTLIAAAIGNVLTIVASFVPQARGVVK